MKILTEEQLKEAAKELGMDLEEVKEMYRRAMSFGLKEDGADAILTSFKAVTAAPNSTTAKRKRAARMNGENQGDLQDVVSKVAAILDLPEFARNAALKSMTTQEKAELMSVMTKMLADMLGNPTDGMDHNRTKQMPTIRGFISDFSGPALDALREQSQPAGGIEARLKSIHDKLDLLTGNPIDILALATRGQFTQQEQAMSQQRRKDMSGVRQPGRTAPMYDAFTSRRLNPGGPIQVTTKEAEQMGLELDEMYHQFDSKRLKGEDDNRITTNNPLYDQFTSQNLNRKPVYRPPQK